MGVGPGNQNYGLYLVVGIYALGAPHNVEVEAGGAICNSRTRGAWVVFRYERLYFP